MSLQATEAIPDGPHVDARSRLEMATFMLDGQLAAIRSENSLHDAAAGRSGLMALADASELRGTFGIPTSKVQIHIAGGVPTDAHMLGGTEDDKKAVETVAETMSRNDVVIVLSASGTTSFALVIARAAKAKGAIVIGIVNNPDTPLLELADEPICIATSPEMIVGSTRLGAGTAQKAPLNLLSTLMGVELGHVYQGEIVNVVANNAKLVQRAVGMASRIACVADVKARAAIAQTTEAVKPAILVASGLLPDRAVTL